MNDKSGSSRNIADVRSAALDRLPELLQHLLPGGKRAGQDWVAGSTAGEQGGSLKANLKTGLWYDHSTGQGGDIFYLWREVNGIADFAESVNTLGDWLNVTPSQRVPLTPTKTPHAKAVALEPAQAIPADAPARPTSHAKLGKSSITWAYYTAEGKPCAFVCRWNKRGKKEIRPLQFADSKWVFEKHFAFPLFNLHLLSQSPSMPVLLVEGEKCAGEAQIFLSDKYIATTWQGGASAIAKTDFSALKDRNVTIWPDNDEAGIKAAEELMRLLPQAAVIDMAQFAAKPKGWDVVDAIRGDRFTAKDLLNVISKTVTKEDLLNVISKTATKEEVETASYLTVKGKIAACSANALTYLKEEGVSVRLDTFSGRIFYNGQALTQAELTRLKMRMSVELDCPSLSGSQVLEGCEFLGGEHKFNAPLEVIKGYQQKADGVPLERLFSECFGVTQTPLLAQYAKAFLVGSIARIMGAGNTTAKVDSMLILVSKKEGIGKTSFFEQLAILSPHETVTSAVGDLTEVEGQRRLRGRQFVVFDEIGSMKTAEHERLRELITMQSVSYRAMRKDMYEQHPITCLFVGTSNTKYLLQSGRRNRRYNIVEIPCEEMSPEQIDGANQRMRKVIAENKGSWYAEALELYNRGFQWWLQSEEHDEHVEQFAEDNVLGDKIDSIVTETLNWKGLKWKTFEIYSQLVGASGNLARVPRRTSANIIERLEALGMVAVKSGSERFYRWEGEPEKVIGFASPAPEAVHVHAPTPSAIEAVFAAAAKCSDDRRGLLQQIDLLTPLAKLEHTGAVERIKELRKLQQFIS